MPTPVTTSAGTRRLTLLYIVALSAVALLTIAGQVAVQWSLAAQQHNSTVVNIAGRQRMLSQKIAKTALLVSHNDEPARRKALVAELAKLSRDWQQAHAGLQHGDTQLELDQQNSAAVQALFAELEPHYAAMLCGIEQIQQGDASQGTAGTQTLLAHEGPFLAKMDEIVFQYDREAQAAVARLQTQERWLLSITLAVLFLEGLVVFRPAVAKIKTTLGDLRRTLVQLDHAKQAAEAASQEKSRFLARMSHELRTPLNAILGLSELLLLPAPQTSERETVQSATIHNHIETIRDAAESLLRLVNDLLDVGRLESGAEVTIEAATFDLRELLQRTTRMFASRAAERHLRLAQQCAENMPPRLIGDAGRIQQVLINLLHNAIKFTDAGEIRVEAKLVDLAYGSCRIAISVRDTGIGIAVVDQQRVFESFTQLAHPQRAKQEGVGLGLSIAGRLANAMGGELRLASEWGRGSTFTLELPLAIDRSTPPADRASAPPMRPLHVLVVEDTPANQLVAREMLAALGHSSQVVEHGAEAIAALGRASFDVVLLDLELPDVSGYDVAREIQASATSPPLVALTAHAMAEHEQRCVAAGFAGFLSKPIRLEQLAATLAIVTPNITPPAMPVVAPQLERWAGRQELLRSLIRLYRDEWPRLVEKIDAAIASGDARQIHFFAHRLKGLVSNFDDEVTSSAAQRLEQCGDSQQLSAATELRGDLVAALAALDRHLAEAAEGITI